MLVVAQEFLGDGMEEDRKSLIKLLKVCLYQRVGAGTHQRQLNAGDHKNTKPNSVALCSWISLEISQARFRKPLGYPWSSYLFSF